MTKSKICRKCSAPFEPSPADRTVNCPACRKPAAPKRRYACAVCADTKVVSFRRASTNAVETEPCYRCSAR